MKLMVRKHFYLPKGMVKKLEDAARRKEISVSELLRRLLETALR